MPDFLFTLSQLDWHKNTDHLLKNKMHTKTHAVQILCFLLTRKSICSFHKQPFRLTNYHAETLHVTQKAIC